MPKEQRSKPKIPILSNDIQTPKIPTYLGYPNLEGRYLSWRLSSADIDGPFSCSQFTPDDFKLLWDRLRAFEKMNVSQFRTANSFHRVPTANITRIAKERLNKLKLDDIDIVYSFRITGTCRLWCMRHENILSVLWWDREHKVYPVGKRHT